MPVSKSSLITLNNLDKKNIDILFSESLKLKHNFNQYQLTSGVYHSGYRGAAALLFFEPSTRTRFSFEAACSRAGYHPLILDGSIGTSIEKGESIEDTIFNIQALRPLFFVVRCNDQVNLAQLESQLDVPVINAGWGRQGHPTQALLDALTLVETLQDLKNKNILFVGDIKHSRVVSSHVELSKKLQYNLGFCAPTELLPTEIDASTSQFSSISEALGWADAVVALRVQKERHDNENLFLIEDYRENFGLNSVTLKNLKAEALIMHPGPVNYGIEIESEFLSDSRCKILKQVENGVFLREALIRKIFDTALADGTGV
jgi:aspartate carbamoyltransferase catalytic subunit